MLIFLPLGIFLLLIFVLLIFVFHDLHLLRQLLVRGCF